jgi:hypothetical protein
MITLRNNVMNLIKLGERSMNPTLRGVIYIIIVTAPAITLAFITRDIKVLVRDLYEYSTAVKSNF